MILITDAMPVGLGETYDGVKIAPDITYTNTFQYPERNSKVLAIHLPSTKRLYTFIDHTVKYAKPNLDIVHRPMTRHIYDETRDSLKNFVSRGLVKSPRAKLRNDERYMRPMAHLNKIPPTTPLAKQRLIETQKAWRNETLQLTATRPYTVHNPHGYDVVPMPSKSQRKTAVISFQPDNAR